MRGTTPHRNKRVLNIEGKFYVQTQTQPEAAAEINGQQNRKPETADATT